MSTKTITLAGSEIKAEFSGSNAWFRNDGADVIYAAAKPGITAGADGVVAIPAGQSAPVYGANGTVWLLGTGSVQLIGSDYSTNPFKTSAQAGGSGADDVARAAINAHSGNAEIHVTSAEKAAWNGKAENIGYWKDSKSIKDYIADVKVSGFCIISSLVTDMPVTGAAWMGVINCSNSSKQITVYKISDNVPCAYSMIYFAPSDIWYDWVCLSDGGNADTVDGKHASEFMQFLGDYRSGSILDAILTLNTSGYIYFGGSNCTDMPVDGAFFYGEVRKYSTLYEIIATNIGTGAVYTNRCNNSHVWYGWKNVGDGGNAASVGAYTEAKLAALEARVAALEGN